MDFKKELVKELRLGTIAEETMLEDYVKACEAIAVRYYEHKVKTLGLFSVINWVAFNERTPEEAWGRYLVCLENNAVFTLDWNSASKRFTTFALGDVQPHNPVKYWSELPEPPCL